MSSNEEKRNDEGLAWLMRRGFDVQYVPKGIVLDEPNKAAELWLAKKMHHDGNGPATDGYNAPTPYELMCSVKADMMIFAAKPDGSLTLSDADGGAFHVPAHQVARLRDAIKAAGISFEGTPLYPWRG